MTLRELMQLCYNAGGYNYDEKPKGEEAGGFVWWWGKYGHERHDAHVAEWANVTLVPMDPVVVELQRIATALEEGGRPKGWIPAPTKQKADATGTP